MVNFCVYKTIVHEKELMHVIMEDLTPLYNTLKEESFLKSLVQKLDIKKNQIQKEIENVQIEIDKFKQNKLNYLNLFTDEVLSKVELVDVLELIGANINELQQKKTQLSEKMNECKNENYAVHISEKLKDVLSLEELTPQILHSLVEKITCTYEGEILIQYSFVNPLQVA